MKEKNLIPCFGNLVCKTTCLKLKSCSNIISKSSITSNFNRKRFIIKSIPFYNKLKIKRLVNTHVV